MTKAFIDSDIVIDFFVDRKPFSIASTKIFSLCARKELKGFITPVIIANVFYILRKALNKDELKLKFINLLKHIDVLIIDKEVVLKALFSDFSDFEDALQNFSVIEHSDIEVIITRNVKDYKHSTLSVYDPETFLSTMN